MLLVRQQQHTGLFLERGALTCAAVRGRNDTEQQRGRPHETRRGAAGQVSQRGLHLYKAEECLHQHDLRLRKQETFVRLLPVLRGPSAAGPL